MKSLMPEKVMTKVMTDTMPQIQESQRTSSMINSKKFTHKHIMLKLQKNQSQKGNLEIRHRVWMVGGENTYLGRNKDMIS